MVCNIRFVYVQHIDTSNLMRLTLDSERVTDSTTIYPVMKDLKGKLYFHITQEMFVKH